MTNLEKRIKKETREWWLRDSNYSKLLSLEELIMKFVTEETKLLSEHILELQKDKGNLIDENKELKELVEKYRQATYKILHITFMGGGCEVNTIGQYATLVDGYLTDVEGLAKWKN